MANTLSLISVYIVNNLILVLNYFLGNSNGLTIRMIHPFSEESPFFKPNLSHESRIRMSVYQSNVRENYLTSNLSLIVQPRIELQSMSHIVKFGIGTFKSKPSYKEYYWNMDTGSGLSWTQCDGCRKCFKQTPKPFPGQNSSSFRPLVDEQSKQTFQYYVPYGDGTSTRGILAKETFYFRSETDETTIIQNLLFGCVLHNDMSYGKYQNNKISGIMGLGWGHQSFVSQIMVQSDGKFSYCFPPLSKNMPKAYLRFGSTVIKSRNAKTTPLSNVEIIRSYYVEMQGISVNKTRLDISTKVFELKNKGRAGGCTIDSGTIYSRIISAAFDKLKTQLEKYFSGFKNLKKTKGGLGFDLCYERINPEGYNNLPEVTFHLRGSEADFVMKPEAVFEVVPASSKMFRKSSEYFCLAMVRSSVTSIIGSYQQTNQRITYDTKNRELVFYADDCVKKP